MKQTLLLSSLLALTLGMSGCDSSPNQKPEDLPWQVITTAEGNTQVFHLDVGKVTLKDVIERFHSFPEMAVFAHESGKRDVEAYFSTMRIGLFEAKIVAELDATPAMLDSFQTNNTKREGMASGQWKYTLSEADMKIADGLRVKRLIYMPMINYDLDIVVARFGEPEERVASQQAGTEYWFYPSKGLAIAMNTNDNEILYYTAKADFAALKQALLEAKPTNDR
jgi:hypothetical protein